MQSELAKAARDFMFLFIVDGGDRGISLDDIEPMELSQKFAALEAALSAAEPEEQDENPMRFFADNVDKWGALEWFNRLVDACEDHDLKRIRAFRCEDVDEKDMLSLSADTSKMIMSSSAFQLARNHKDEIRSALSAQVQDVAGTVEAFDRDHPELYWHLAKGKITAGEPLYGAIITDLRGNELGLGESDIGAIDALKIAVYDAALPAAPAKQED